jgi:hypothetical protein
VRKLRLISFDDHFNDQKKTFREGSHRKVFTLGLDKLKANSVTKPPDRIYFSTFGAPQTVSKEPGKKE